MLEKIKKLIEQKDDIIDQLTKELNKVKINELDDESLLNFFNIVFPTFTSYNIYSPSDLDELFDELNFTYHSTFNMDRHQVMDYDDLISSVYEWEERYHWTVNDCNSLKKWANTSDLTEAKKKFEIEVIKISLSSRNRGFTHDW